MKSQIGLVEFNGPIPPFVRARPPGLFTLTGASSSSLLGEKGATPVAAEAASCGGS